MAKNCKESVPFGQMAQNDSVLCEGTLRTVIVATRLSHSFLNDY
jgi:hypothetical protein